MLPVFGGVRVAHLLLLLRIYYFSCFMFSVVFVFFPCLVFVPGLHSRILVNLITPPYLVLQIVDLSVMDLTFYFHSFVSSTSCIQLMFGFKSSYIPDLNAAEAMFLLEIHDQRAKISYTLTYGMFVSICL